MDYLIPRTLAKLGLTPIQKSWIRPNIISWFPNVKAII